VYPEILGEEIARSEIPDQGIDLAARLGQENVEVRQLMVEHSFGMAVLPAIGCHLMRNRYRGQPVALISADELFLNRSQAVLKAKFQTTANRQFPDRDGKQRHVIADDSEIGISLLQRHFRAKRDGTTDVSCIPFWKRHYIEYLRYEFLGTAPTNIVKRSLNTSDTLCSEIATAGTRFLLLDPMPRFCLAGETFTAPGTSTKS